MKFCVGLSVLLYGLMAQADVASVNDYNGYQIGKLFMTAAQRHALDAARKPVSSDSAATSYQWNGVVMRQQYQQRYIYQDVSVSWINQQKLQAPAKQQSLNAKVAADFSQPLRLHLITDEHVQSLKPGDTWLVESNRLIPLVGSENVN